MSFSNFSIFDLIFFLITCLNSVLILSIFNSKFFNIFSFNWSISFLLYIISLISSKIFSWNSSILSWVNNAALKLKIFSLTSTNLWFIISSECFILLLIYSTFFSLDLSTKFNEVLIISSILFLISLFSLLFDSLSFLIFSKSFTLVERYCAMFLYRHVGPMKPGTVKFSEISLANVNLISFMSFVCEFIRTSWVNNIISALFLKDSNSLILCSSKFFLEIKSVRDLLFFVICSKSWIYLSFFSINSFILTVIWIFKRFSAARISFRNSSFKFVISSFDIFLFIIFCY